ncbi:MAG: hypothetical protein KAT04_00140 [Methylococcales bacterium]|nr:hypothetical protein [Methylococcales bacterium]
MSEDKDIIIYQAENGAIEFKADEASAVRNFRIAQKEDGVIASGKNRVRLV